MKMKRFFAVASLATLMLANVAPTNSVSAAGDASELDGCFRYLEREEEKGLIVFTWEDLIDEKNVKHIAEKKCFWLVTDESQLRRSFRNIFTNAQIQYLIDNAENSIGVTWKSFGEGMGLNEEQVERFLNGRFGLVAANAWLNRLRRRNAAESGAYPAASVTVTEDGAAEAAPAAEVEDIHSVLVSGLGDAPRPAELAIDGVVVYYYRGWVPGTYWVGYRITNSDLFANWCRNKKGLSENVIKTLVACQNTWVAGVSSLYGDETVRGVFPEEFFNALEAVVSKQSNGSDASTYVLIKDTRFGAVIDNSDATKQSIRRQFERFGLHKNSAKAIVDNPWNYSWKSPISWRLNTLRQNGDIA